MGGVKVRFAPSIALGPPDPGHLTAVATEAESLGFDTLWFADVPSRPVTDPMLGVAYVAAGTSRVKLGVNFVPFGHQPFLFAKQVAQLDDLARGRLLVTLVPGLDLPGEREAVGMQGRHRGQAMDELIPELRSLWSTHWQREVEVWLGGSTPEAVSRAGRLSDGWLGSRVSPDRAGAISIAIQDAARQAGRTIDPEHFGLSIGYAREADDIGRAIRLRPPKPARPEEATEVMPVGAAALRDLIHQLTDNGLSKFVVRRIAPVDDWSDELRWLADTLLDLQT
jgi:alkanesulfonate monooxygenase SsuD/methylene tetrahydromethanopterin reductase-like flavin-dependent oxidoreductase (luciferase family)